ncbi:hypothetical protein JCGZ_17181 [Jatropha curcas]|uniref:Uncharacterized protein n=1 Tax=Jatropha curcas TaxID=180498 RepID=A0A067LMD6_JATCU|nr:hypothetical protein JCGZ_17181 [Jatropha curcas]
MARGRAFDSDMSGSGTSGASSSAQRPILSPSHPSSGTSGASSSAQRPVLPPSLPFIPSSSTPVSGPVQSPPVAQSPPVQASSDPRISLSLVVEHIYPSSRASRQIMGIIKLQLHKEGCTWDAENYTTARERLVSSQTDESEAESRIDEPEHTTEEFIELQARVDDQQRQIAELRAHVMRLSSADNTLVTPLGTTAHPADTPPGDSTSDRADEQPRRFDFRPF